MTTATLRDHLDPPPAPALIPTAKKGVYLAESSRPGGGVFYTVSNVGTPFVICSCPAGRHDKPCKHAIAGLELSARLMKKEQDDMTTEEKTMAVTLAEKSPTVIKAEEARLAAAAYLGGWEDMKSLAAEHIRSGFAPKGIDKPEQGAMVLLKAVEMNIPITAAYEFIAVIGGRPKLMGQMVDALVSRSQKGYIHIEETDSQHCVAVGYREGRKPIRITFTIEDLNRMGVNNDNHKKFPADHCRWKAIARVGRVMFPDVLSGMDVVGPDGSMVDSVDMSQEEGHETGRHEVLDGEYRVVHDATDAGAHQSGGEAAGGSVPAATEPPLSSGWTFDHLSASLKSEKVSVKDLAPVLGVAAELLTREAYPGHINTWLAADKERSIEQLVFEAGKAKSGAAKAPPEEPVPAEQPKQRPLDPDELPFE